LYYFVGTMKEIIKLVLSLKSCSSSQKMNWEI